MRFALTISNKVLRHMEGDFDGERAGILGSIDNGKDTRADGDQRQGGLVQRTVWVAWRERREKTPSHMSSRIWFTTHDRMTDFYHV